MRSTHDPDLSQRLPADQRTPEGQERLVDVGPFVVPDAQTSKLIQPGKRPLDDPPPPPRPLPCVVRRIASKGRM